MAASKYVRFGLRADANLSDLPNQNTALSNVLDNLIPDVTFTPQDLKVIDDLQLTDVYASDLSGLAGKEITFRPYQFNNDGSVSIGNQIPVEPTITIKDRIVNRKVILGDPPYSLGGSGPHSSIVPVQALYNASTYTPPTPIISSAFSIRDENFGADNVVNFASGDIVTDEDYWIDGRFAFANVFHPTFDDLNGGLSWEGYLSWPTDKTIRIETNGFFLIEVDKTNTNNWELVKGVWSEEIPLVVDTITGPDALTFTVFPEAIDYLCLGMVVVDNSDPVNNPNAEFEIVRLVRSTGLVEVQPTENSGSAIGLNFGTYNGSTPEIAKWSLGVGVIDTAQFDLDSQFKGETKHYRFTSWWPDPAQLGKAETSYRTKYVVFDANDSGRDDFMPFNYWYKDPQNQGGAISPFTYEYFKKNKVGKENSVIDKRIQNEKPVFIRYEPKITSVELSRYNSGTTPQTTTLVWNGDFSFSVVDPENENLGPIQVGDILLFADGRAATGVSNIQPQYYLHVYEKSSTTLFVNPITHTDLNTIMSLMGTNSVTNSPYVAGSAIPFNVVTSVGLTFIGQYNGGDQNLGGGSGAWNYDISKCNNANDSFNGLDIKADNLVLTMNRGVNNTLPYVRRITEIDPLSTDATDVSFNTHPVNTDTTVRVVRNGYVLVYSHRGLNDNSISTQCVGVYGKENATFPVVSAGGTKIYLYDTEGITVGDVIQYPGFIPGYNPAYTGSDANQNGVNSTTVTSINAPDTNSGALDASQLPLSLPSVTISRPLLVDLPNAYTLIFIKNNAIFSHTVGSIVQDKNYCVLPLNTAPPFLGNNTGLSTSIDYPHMKINGDMYITGLQLAQATTRDIAAAGYGTSSAAEATGGMYIKGYLTDKSYWILSK